MRLKTVILGKTYQFKDIKEVLAKANEEKSGDVLAGIAAESGTERIAAKEVLSNLLVSDLRNNPVVPYEQDDVTRIIQDAVSEPIYNKISNMTIGELREYILSHDTDERAIRHLSRGLTSEVIAGVCKLMSNLDLIYAASKVRVTAHCNTTIGVRGTLSTRLQPNHTTDGVEGITASLFEGLSYGCGDALLGLN
ncbi:MAG: ethanolamine ammonia-lyase subunit EutB, partial [Acutalibacteraceae bacterium]